MITNGKDTPLGQSTSALPSVAEGVITFLQPVQVGIIKTTQIKGYTQTFVEQYIDTKGVRIQNPNNLVVTKTGERIWDSLDIYFLSNILLVADDLFLYLGVQYRVMMVETWPDYGYNKYSVVQDYTKLSDNILDIS